MNSKNKILFLHAGAELYGSDRILLSIVTNLDKNIFEPIVVLPNDGPLVDELKRRTVRVEVIPYPILRRKYYNPIGILTYLIAYRRACSKLADLVRKENIRLVHSNTIAVLEGITIKKRCGIVLISHIHEMLDRPRFVARFLYRKHVRAADKIICVSNAVKNHIEKYVCYGKKVVVVHNGIMPIEKMRSDIRKNNGIPEHAKLFSIVGRINAIKGQNDFIEAVRKAREKDAKIYGLIVGDTFTGQEWRIKEIRDEITRCGLEKYIKLVGFVSEMSYVYSAIDVLVLPSVQNDSFPTVVLEAMSCGVPTVAYKCGGVEEMIINGRNGYLVNKGDISNLAEKMILVASKNDKIEVKKIFCEKYELRPFIEKIQNEYILTLKGVE